VHSCHVARKAAREWSEFNYRTHSNQQNQHAWWGCLRE